MAGSNWQIAQRVFTVLLPLSAVSQASLLCCLAVVLCGRRPREQAQETPRRFRPVGAAAAHFASPFCDDAHTWGQGGSDDRRPRGRFARHGGTERAVSQSLSGDRATRGGRTMASPALIKRVEASNEAATHFIAFFRKLCARKDSPPACHSQHARAAMQRKDRGYLCGGAAPTRVAVRGADWRQKVRDRACARCLAF